MSHKLLLALADQKHQGEEMPALRLDKIVIIGGGTAGWMTAAALSHMLGGQNIAITLVESDEIGTVGVGEATVPHIRFFNARLGIDEADFMARTKATYKLGIEFKNWGKLGDSYIHPFGAFGHDIGGVGFHHHWTRLRQAGDVGSLQDFSLPIAMCHANKFAHPDPDPASLLSTYSYAFQFDAGLYAAYLRDYSIARGVKRIEGKVTEVVQDGQNGFVTGVKLDKGQAIEGQLFVDCSGFRGLLIEEALQTGYEDWSAWLPCDRAVAVPCETVLPITPYTRATAQAAGWTWRIPLQHRTGNGHVFCSSYTDNDQALDCLLGQLDSTPTAQPRFLSFKTGKRVKQWNKNVVAIGLSAGFLEPLESTSIHLIQLAIGRLLEFFPDCDFDPLAATEYNRLMDLEYTRVRDFLILHYHATTRTDTPFWDYVRTMSIPDSLAYKMDLFKARGLVVNYKDGMFLDASWLAVYFGQNVIPLGFDPRASATDPAVSLAALSMYKADCLASMARLPSHGDFLADLVKGHTL
jgi:tryptophan 7-halogenase